MDTEIRELPGPFLYRDAVVFTCFCGTGPDLVAIEGGPEVECCHCGRHYRKRIAGPLIEVARVDGPQVAGPS